MTTVGGRGAERGGGKVWPTGGGVSNDDGGRAVPS
jgi:hypothetical protein